MHAAQNTTRNADNGSNDGNDHNDIVVLHIRKRLNNTRGMSSVENRAVLEGLNHIFRQWYLLVVKG
jgi:hypothetical protein